MLFRREAVEDKRRRVYGSVILTQPLSLKITGAVLLLFAALAVAFLATFEFQRKETVPGYIGSSAGLISLYAKNGGTLVRRHVEPGDEVAAGTVLFELTTDVESTYGPTRRKQLQTTEENLEQVEAQIQLTRMSHEKRLRYLETQRAGLDRRLQLLSRRIAIKQEMVRISEEDLGRLQQLHSESYVSDRDLARQLDVSLTHRSELDALEAELDGIHNEIDLIGLEIAGLPTETSRDLSSLEVQRNNLFESRLEREAKRRYRVSAPVSGTVVAIQGEIGEDVVPGTPVVRLIPTDSRLVAYLLAPSSAIGFLKTNAEVSLKLDAYPYQQFGVQTGRISRISGSSFKPGELNTPIAHEESVYRIEVNLTREFITAYGDKYPLQVDMTLTGDLIIDRRTLLEWMLDPLRSVRL